MVAYYERMNLILDGWREVDEIVDSQFPAEVMRRFGDVNEEEVKKIQQEGLRRSRAKAKSLKKKRKTGRGMAKTGAGGGGLRDGSELDGNISDRSNSDSSLEENENAFGDSTDDEEGLVFGGKKDLKGKSLPGSRRGSFAKAFTGWFSPVKQDSSNGRGRKIRDLEQGNSSSRNQSPFEGRNTLIGNAGISSLSETELNKSNSQRGRTLTYGSTSTSQSLTRPQESKPKAGIVRSIDPATGQANSLENPPPNNSEEIGSLDRELANQREEKKEKEIKKDTLLKEAGFLKKDGEDENQPLLAKDYEDVKSQIKPPKSAVEISRERENERTMDRSRERRSLLDSVPGQAEKQAKAEGDAQFAINSELA